MSFSTIFIRRPVATSLLMLAVVLLGALSYRELPVSALPDIDAPSLQVTTYYPGASPGTIAALVTTPLERQFGQISGLTLMTSDSSAGLSTINLQFQVERDIDAAAQDVQAAINAARGSLPSGLPYPPVYNKVNPADAPILTLKLSSQTLPLRDINYYADSILAQKLAQISGVGLVSIAGNLRPAVRVQVNPGQLANLGLTLEDVRAALSQLNVSTPKGSLNGKVQSFSISANDQLRDAAAYREAVISWRGEAAIRLKDVAQVIDSVENDQVSAWADGEPAVLLDIRRQPGANIVSTVEQIRSILPQLRAVLPAGVDLAVFADRTLTIRASVHDVQFTLILSVILVVAVIFVFLRRLWATLIPGVAVPLSLLGTFAVMSFAGFSLDNLSLMALTVATGFVVDDAIVMIENIVRYLEKGRDSRVAAEKGAREIAFTVVSLTVSLIAVFLPLLLMPGVTGRLFREFAWVLSIAVALSALVSLTLTPMMCAYLLKPGAATDQPEIPARPQGVYGRTLAVYDRSLLWALAHPRLTLLAATASVVLTALLYLLIPKGLLPEQDTGLVTAVVEADDTIAFPLMQSHVQAVAAALRDVPDVAGVAAFVGSGAINPTLNRGQLSIVLKPRGERRNLARVLPALQQAAAGIPAVALYLKPVQDIALDSRVGSTEYQYTLTDIDIRELAAAATRLVAALRQRPELRDVDSNLAAHGLQLLLTIDRDQASRLGVAIQDINDTLYSAFGQRQISTIFTELNQYRVVLEVAPEFRTRGDLLDKLSVRASGNGSVPLASVARAQVTNAPLVISHQGQLPAVTLGFNTASGYSLSDAIAAIRSVEQQAQLPASVRGGFVGKAAEFSASQANELYLILAAVIVIYIVLGVLYESYIHPLTILSTLPPAGVGALLALFVCGMSLSIDGIVGIILLIGIVKKNAILMIDFAIEAQRTGLHARDAIRRACLLRLRPILMTTAAALLGALPLALGDGIGAELRRPLGVAIVGGLLFSQLVTLYTTPVIYLYLERIRTWPQRRRAGADVEPAVVAP
ncbi:MAG: efflux RND transporter permease subunit [Rhodanobacteraceae bacterium]|nr:efflux RND transporter permease subunit [Rhodanobacteraceae bacterium]